MSLFFPPIRLKTSGSPRWGSCGLSVETEGSEGRAEIGDVLELPEYLNLHRVVGQGRRPSDINSIPGNSLQLLHRLEITESPIQYIPIIQQRPLVSSTARMAAVECGRYFPFPR